MKKIKRRIKSKSKGEELKMKRIQRKCKSTEDERGTKTTKKNMNKIKQRKMECFN